MYTTIFNTRPKKENKLQFCQRIVGLLNEIEFYSSGYIYSGQKMLNCLFKYSELNHGYSSIDDLLNESGHSNSSIFKLCNMPNDIIEEEDILINIDIIMNCLYSYNDSNDNYFCSEEQSSKTIEIIFKAINEYLLSNGLKLYDDEKKQQVFIVENATTIDINDIDEKNIKDKIISYYDYRNANNLDEKKDIIVSIIGKLEAKKQEIGSILGTKIADMFSNYANNFNLRHNNSNPNYKKYFNQQIANLSEEELLKWYDYIFAFMINIYLSLDNLKNVNVNDGYK